MYNNFKISFIGWSIKVTLFLILLMMLPDKTMQQCLTSNDSQTPTNPVAKLSLVNGQQEFSLKMLQIINSMYPHQNIIYSPHSVYQAMLLAYFVSANHTEDSIKNALFLPDDQEKLSTMQLYRVEKYFLTMRKDHSYELNSANRLFISPEESVKDCMLDLFKDEIAKVDFKNPVKAADTINKWVSALTKGNIKELVQDLDQDSKLILANAAYFKGVWKSKFLKENTRKDIFYINNSKKEFVTMMRQKGSFNHAVSETLGAHVLELPYKGDDVSMYILLPPFVSPNGVTNVLKRLTMQTFKDIVTQQVLSARQVEVSIPKFTIDQNLGLVPILRSLGIDMFDKTADFSSLTGKSGISFNDAIHKAKIKVDEEGTTAAAATAILSFRSSRPLDPAQFICNHPFIYLLYDKVSQSVLFMGIYSSPNGAEPES